MGPGAAAAAPAAAASAMTQPLRPRLCTAYARSTALPHVPGLRGVGIAELCPALRVLRVDEASSAVGGLTDDLARALALHCPCLEVLEASFERYSLPSELFTDEGLITLSEGCRRLTALTLINCDRISDRCVCVWYQCLPVALCRLRTADAVPLYTLRLPRPPHHPFTPPPSFPRLPQVDVCAGCQLP